MLRFGSEVAPAIHTFDGFKSFLARKNSNGRLMLASADNEVDQLNLKKRPVDISWLPASAPTYNVSPHIKDYVITEIPIVTAGIPNRNLDCFTLEALQTFNPTVGRTAYQTFIGKPTHINHDNRDPLKAKGVIFDAKMVQYPSGGYKVHILAGWDRTKDPTLANAILRRERTGHSMGCMVGYTECSVCHAKSPEGRILCAHIEGGSGKGRHFMVDGKRRLAYELCFELNYVESSNVDDPADPEAFDLSAS